MLRTASGQIQAWASGSASILGSVGLCFGRVFFLTSGSNRVGGGAPMCSRAADLTAVTALNGLGFFFFAIVLGICNELLFW